MTEQITILMTAYNAAAWIGEAIASVFVQSNPNWKLLIVDDGSTDQTGQIVDAFMSRVQSDISVVRTEHVNGCHATKVGIEAAQTDLITMLDADDILMIDSIDRILREASARPDCGFGWTRFRQIRGPVGWAAALPTEKTLKEALLSGWWGANAQRFFRKSFYLQTAGLDPSVPSAEDLQLAALFGELGCSTLSINQVTYLYRGSHREKSEESASAHEILRRLRTGELACTT
jgi:glycosyltransferase involved in cell wall biosynthesis